MSSIVQPVCASCLAAGQGLVRKLLCRVRGVCAICLAARAEVVRNLLGKVDVGVRNLLDQMGQGTGGAPVFLLLLRVHAWSFFVFCFAYVA